ncbi:MAG: hypothetical protein HY769_01600 [Candidatus Stahlbacteria bacterium]|nr:hypothetical protein [Candidatus Stahlbacteria bacterium]
MMYLLFFLPIYTVSADSSILMDSTTYLYGNVKFIHDSIQITSKTGIITVDRVKAYDSVQILNGELKIITDFGEYFWDKRIVLHNGFTAYKKDELLKAIEAKYFEDKLWLTDSIKYVNTKENWLLYGQEGFYDTKTRFIMITGEPKFELLQDSIEIFGDTMKVYADTLTKVIHNAMIKLSTTQCFAESLIYLPKTSEAWLYGKPIIVSESDSLKGVKMKITLKEREIERVLVEGNVLGKRWKF